MQTAWTIKSAQRYQKLDTNIKTDVAIVGGGLCGVLTAYLLAKSGKRVALVEQKRLGSNATEFTTAFLTRVVDTELSELVSLFGKPRARLVWESHQKAIDLIESIASNENIDCEFARCSNFVYARNKKEAEILQEEWKAAKSLGFKVEYHQLGKLGFNYYAYLEIKNQAKFHPMKFLAGVAKAAQKHGALIYEQTQAEKITGTAMYKVHTPKGVVTADHVVIATYDPLGNPKATRFKKGMYVSYVQEYEVEQGLFREGIYEDLANPYHYFRVDPINSKKDRVIFGGEDHREEINMSKAKNFKALEDAWKEIVGKHAYQLVRTWDGPILEPSDGLALIGRIKNNLYVACAFSGNGMTYSGIAAEMFRDLIHNKKNIYAKLYDPTRISSIKQLWQKGKDYAEELARGAVRNSMKYRND